MQIKNRNKIIMITLIVGMCISIIGFFVYQQVQSSSVIQTQKKVFQQKIMTATELVNADKQSEMKVVADLRQIENEIQQFHQNVYFVNITATAFKDEQELIVQKINQATDYINFLYKVKLDTYVRNPAELNKVELKSLQGDLDNLWTEIQVDQMLSQDVMKTFEDKIIEMKAMYGNAIQEIETKEDAQKVKTDKSNNQNAEKNEEKSQKTITNTIVIEETLSA